MQKIHEITYDQLYSGELFPRGIYVTRYREGEDSGWIVNKVEYYFFDGIFPSAVWVVTDNGSNQETFYSVRFSHCSRISSTKEYFVDFVKENSPDVLEWVLFNVAHL